MPLYRIFLKVPLKAIHRDKAVSNGNHYFYDKLIVKSIIKLEV